MLEITAVEQNKEKRMKRNEDSLKALWDNINYPTPYPNPSPIPYPKPYPNPHTNPNPNPKLPLTASASNRFPKH